MASEPDFIVCIDCETPCYSFTYKGATLVEALCECCGNEDIETFGTEEEFDAMMSDI